MTHKPTTAKDDHAPIAKSAVEFFSNARITYVGKYSCYAHISTRMTPEDRRIVEENARKADAIAAFFSKGKIEYVGKYSCYAYIPGKTSPKELEKIRDGAQFMGGAFTFFSKPSKTRKFDNGACYSYVPGETTPEDHRILTAICRDGKSPKELGFFDQRPTPRNGRESMKSML